MNPLKNAAKKLLGALGYELRSKAQLGLDPLNDIERIAGRVETIFDVGAHEGESAVEYAQRFPAARIHSFEPAPDSFKMLQRNVARFSNVKPVNAALGDSDGTSTLHVNEFSATNSLLAPTDDVADATTKALLKPVGTRTIQIQRLDSYCREQAIARITLLKLDVQGFELHVLNGAKDLLAKRAIRLIYCELSLEKFYASQPLFQDVYLRLLQEGFQLVDLYGHTRSQHQAIRWCDGLFVHAEAPGHAGG